MTSITTPQIRLFRKANHLTPYHQELMELCAGFQNAGKTCFKSLAAIAADLNCSIRKAGAVKADLVELGILSSKRTGGACVLWLDLRSAKCADQIGKFCRYNKQTTKQKENKNKSTPEAGDDQKPVEISYQQMREQFTADNIEVQALAKKHGIDELANILQAFVKRWAGCSAYYSASLQTWLNKLDGWFARRGRMDADNAARKQAAAQRGSKSQGKKRYSFLALARGEHLQGQPWPKSKMQRLADQSSNAVVSSSFNNYVLPSMGNR